MLTLMAPKFHLTSDLHQSPTAKEINSLDRLYSENSFEAAYFGVPFPKVHTPLNSSVSDFESSSTLSSTPMFEPKHSWASRIRVSSNEDIRDKVRGFDETPIRPLKDPQYYSKTDSSSALDYDVYRNQILETILKRRYSEQQPPGSVVFNYFHLSGIDSKQKVEQCAKTKELGLWDVFEGSPSDESWSVYADGQYMKCPADYFLLKGNQKYPTVEKSTGTKVSSKQSVTRERSEETLILDRPITPKLKLSSSKRLSATDNSKSSKPPAKWSSASINAILPNSAIGKRIQLSRQIYRHVTHSTPPLESVQNTDALPKIPPRPKTADSRLYNERCSANKIYDSSGRETESSSENESMCDTIKVFRTKSFHGKTSSPSRNKVPSNINSAQMWLPGNSGNSFNRKYSKKPVRSRRPATQPQVERLVVHHDEKCKSGESQISKTRRPSTTFSKGFAKPMKKKFETKASEHITTWEPLIEDESEASKENKSWSKFNSDDVKSHENCDENVHKQKINMQENSSATSVVSSKHTNAAPNKDLARSSGVRPPIHSMPRVKRRIEPSKLPTFVRKQAHPSEAINNETVADDELGKESSQHSNTGSCIRPRSPFRPLIEALERSAKGKSAHAHSRERNNMDFNSESSKNLENKDIERSSLDDRLKMFKSPATESFLKGLNSERQVKELNYTTESVTEQPSRPKTPKSTWEKFVKNSYLKRNEKNNDNEKRTRPPMKSPNRQKSPATNKAMKEPIKEPPPPTKSSIGEENLKKEENKTNLQPRVESKIEETTKKNSKVGLAMQMGLRLYIKKLKSVLSDRNATSEDLQSLANMTLPDAVAPDLESFLNEGEIRHLRSLLANAEQKSAIGKNSKSPLVSKFVK